MCDLQIFGENSFKERISKRRWCVLGTLKARKEFGALSLGLSSEAKVGPRAIEGGEHLQNDLGRGKEEGTGPSMKFCSWLSTCSRVYFE